MNGPIPNKMYKIKPVFCLPEDLDLPTNMYRIKNIHCTSNQAPSSGQDERTIALDKGLSNEYADIQKRQSVLLQQLTDLQNQMTLFRKQLNEKIPTMKTSESSTILSSSSPTSKKPNFKQGGVIHDIVIYANPKHPPYSLLAINKLWGDRMTLQVSSHIHSTITAVPEQSKLFEGLKNVNQSKNVSDPSHLNVTLVWKEIGVDCELIISPLNHCTIRGEVNVIRYLHRHLDNTDDAIAETKLDSLLDRCHCLQHATTSKEKKSIVKALNAALGKAQWMSGSGLSLADVAAWSVIRNDAELELTQSLSKWIERCNVAIGIGA